VETAQPRIRLCGIFSSISIGCKVRDDVFQAIVRQLPLTSTLADVMLEVSFCSVLGGGGRGGCPLIRLVRDTTVSEEVVIPEKEQLFVGAYASCELMQYQITENSVNRVEDPCLNPNCRCRLEYQKKTGLIELLAVSIHTLMMQPMMIPSVFGSETAHLWEQW
jgi:hypothetical protein